MKWCAQKSLVTHEVPARMQALQGQHTHLWTNQDPKGGPCPSLTPASSKAIESSACAWLGYSPLCTRGGTFMTQLGPGSRLASEVGTGLSVSPDDDGRLWVTVLAQTTGPESLLQAHCCSSCRHLPPASAGHTGWASGRSSAGPFLTPASVSLPLTGGKGRTAKPGLRGQERL